jgi:hypothetical protein
VGIKLYNKLLIHIKNRKEPVVLRGSWDFFGYIIDFTQWTNKCLVNFVDISLGEGGSWFDMHYYKDLL